MAWAGLSNSLKNKVGVMMPTCCRFDTLDEFFDQAAVLEVTLVVNKKPQRQQQQQQQQQQKQQQKQPAGTSYKYGKQGYRPSISQPADTSSRVKSGQSESNRQSKSGGSGQSSGLPPAPWVSTEIIEG